MYRRSRSPEYRNKPYSPSRPLSPGPSGPPPRVGLPARPRSPPRQGGRPVEGYRSEYEYDAGPRSSDRYALGAGRYAPPRQYQHQQQRYGSPPRGRYNDDEDEHGRYGARRDEREPRRGRSRSRSPPPPPRQRDWDRPADRLDEHDRPERQEATGRMVVDRFVPPPRVPPQAAAEVWDRGRNVDELDVGVSRLDGGRADPQAEYDESERRRGAHGRGPTDPSKDVIFLGLDPELTEYEVSC